MDTRTKTTTAPEFYSWKLITDQDVLQRLHDAEKALDIDYSTLQDILTAEAAPEKVSAEMEQHITEIKARAQKAIESVAATETNDERVKEFIAKQKNDLQKNLASVNKHLQARKRGLLDAHKTAISQAQQALSSEDESFYGNYTYKLNVLKKNIIIALQKAAEQHVKLWSDHAKENRTAFNTIMLGIANLQENGALEYDTYNTLYPDVEMQTLSDTQALINKVLNTCKEQNNTLLYRSIKDHLSRLSRTAVATTKDGSQLFTVEQGQNDVQFTDVGFKVEELSQAAKQQAKNQAAAFKNREAVLFDDFADDDYVRESQTNLLASARQAFSDIETFEKILRQADQLNLRLQDAALTIPELEARLNHQHEYYTDNVNEITYDHMSNDKKNPLYELYYLDDERRNRIIDKLDEAFNTCYERLDYQNKIQSSLANVIAARNEITNIQDRIKKLTDKAAAKSSPLAMPKDELRDIERHAIEVEMMLRGAEAESYKLQAAFEQVEIDHIADRAELVEAMPRLVDNDYRFTLPRSKFTLNNLGPTKAPEEKPGFWARNRWLKGALIGAAVGLGVAAATVAVITPIGLVATAVAAIGVGFTVGAIVGGSALLTAIGGVVGGLIGKFTGPKPEPEDNISVSSTASMQQAMALDDEGDAPTPTFKQDFAALHAEMAPPSATESLSEASKAARGLRDQATRNLELTQQALHRAQKLANGGQPPKGKEEEEPDHSPILQRHG